MRRDSQSGRPDRSSDESLGRVEALQERVDALESQSERSQRAEHESLRREQQLRLHNAVLARLSMSTPLTEQDEFAARREIVIAASEALQVTRVGIWMFDSDKSELRAMDLYDCEAGFRQCDSVLLAERYPKYFKALRENRTLPAHDARNDPNTSELSEDYLKPCGITSMLDAPVRVDGEVVGVICHEHIGSPREWSLDEQTFAGSMGDFVSLTLQATRRREMEREIKRQRAFLRQIIDISPNLVFVLDHEGRFVLVNQALAALTGNEPRDLVGQSAFELVGDDAKAERFRLMDQEILSSRHAHLECEEMFRSRSGREYWFQVSKRPITAVDGSTRQVLGVASDITDRKLYQEHLSTMVRELDHRVKNNLFAVMIMAEHTALASDNLEEFLPAFNGRIRSMAVAHEVLAQSNWQGADLNELLIKLLAPYLGDESDRAELQGDAVSLPPNIAPAVCMMFHELATNAVKHGALATPNGRVQVRWHVADHELHLQWVERHGSGIDEPDHRGFGLELIERTARHQLRGEVDMVFEAKGLTCAVEIPLHSPAEQK